MAILSLVTGSSTQLRLGRRYQDIGLQIHLTLIETTGLENLWSIIPFLSFLSVQQSGIPKGEKKVAAGKVDWLLKISLNYFPPRLTETRGH